MISITIIYITITGISYVLNYVKTENNNVLVY